MNAELPEGVTDTFECMCKWCGSVLHVERGKLQTHSCLIELQP